MGEGGWWHQWDGWRVCCIDGEPGRSKSQQCVGGCFLHLHLHVWMSRERGCGKGGKSSL